MILWINGAFGVGKTQTALLLRERIADSFLFDPEEIGGALRRTVPHADDFQDIPLWRSFTCQTLRQIVRDNPTTTFIVPMTLVNRRYHDEIVGKLCEDGIPVLHFTLMASSQTIRERLLQRGDGSESWSARQVACCTNALSAPEFALHLDTETRSAVQIADEIVCRAMSFS